jgi:hypothetical protein
MEGKYRCEFIPENAILYEFKGDFNIKAFEDDSFIFSDQFHVYFQTSSGFFRAIKSPFYLGDILNIGQLSMRKKHIPVGPIKTFLLHKEVLYADAWSLHYDYQRKLDNPQKTYYGEYKFFIESPLTFLEHAPTLLGALNNLTLIEFSSRFNQLVQHDVFKVLKSYSHINIKDNEKKLHEAMKQKLEPYGIAVTHFTLNSSK